MILTKSQKISGQMSEEDFYREALALALRKLKTRDRFESEIRLFLVEFPTESVERVIRFLKERRIIDDTKTTFSLVERYSGRRSIGLEKLRAELVERGAPEETIDVALGNSAVGEGDKMLEALSAKFSPGDGARAKAARFLFSRGFPEEEIESALDRFFRT